MFVNPTATDGVTGYERVTDTIKHYKGGAFDIHKPIVKSPKPNKGWTLPGILILVLIIQLKNKLSVIEKLEKF